METSTLKHFDYLTEHSSDLETALGCRDLSKDIDYWRCSGMEHPDGPLVGSRRVVETALKTLAKPLPNDRMNLKAIIDYLEDEGTIDRVIALKCHEIRRKGNAGAHQMSVKAVDAQMALDLLDDFLRWCAEDLHIIPAHASGMVPVDPIFIVRSSDEVAEVTEKAHIAAALDNDKGIEKKLREAKGEIDSCDDSVMSDLQKMEELIRQAEELGVSITKSENEEALAAQRRLFDGFERKIEELNAKRQTASTHFDKVSTEVQTILNEHDFISKLVQGGGLATLEQHGVMAFPRGAHSVTNILQVAGGAGTGKTFCLLAKLISEVENNGQQSLLKGQERKALFVCFNKGLANYVRNIMEYYEGEGAKPNIEVESYDEYINQLVRRWPKTGYKHLSRYATNVKYPREMICYSNSDQYVELLNEAQMTVAKRYPSRAKDYYLNTTDRDELEWLKEELQWIEARFSDSEEAAARYPKAERVGRGTKHRPSEAMRRVILEVWNELNRLLVANRLYTIEHATKRLMGANSLPTYDAIAIDEVQDFSLISIKLLLRFRNGDGSKVFLSGDENQKIYHRDFTWKELDEGVRGYTITLRKNMRNYPAIERFSDRLIGINSPKIEDGGFVHVVNASERKTLDLLRRLSTVPGQTTALICSGQNRWEQKLQLSNVPFMTTLTGRILSPGLYILNTLNGKGLEFDNVVVDYTHDMSEDEDEEKRLRYVHFTRARRRLYIRYQGTPPKLLSKYYSDYLE